MYTSGRWVMAASVEINVCRFCPDYKSSMFSLFTIEFYHKMCLGL